MNPIHSAIVAQRLPVPVNVNPQPHLSGAQARHNHPNTLSPARLSLNTRLALDRLEAQPPTSGHHHLLALLVSNGLAEGALRILASKGTEACYGQDVDTPNVTGPLDERENGKLTVHAKLNEHAEYEIIDINFRVPSSSAPLSVNLSYPLPAVTKGDKPAVQSGDQRYISGDLAAQYSKGQLTRALLSLNSPQDFSGYRSPSHASTSPRSFVFSNEGSAAGGMIPDPIRQRTQASQGKSLAPYPASSSQIATSSGEKKVSSGRMPDPDNPRQAISAGTLKSSKRVPDPDNPGQMISRTTLSSRKLVPDPDHPGQMISRSKLSDRQQVPDPKNPGQTISRSMRKGRRRVPDPDNPGQMITPDALRKRERVPDPKNPGQTISRNALTKRQQVTDPDNPSRTIAQSALRRRLERRRSRKIRDSRLPDTR